MADTKFGRKKASEETSAGKSLQDVYAVCDAAIGDLLAGVKEDTSVIVSSLHGMGINHSRTEALPEMVERIIRNETGQVAFQRPRVFNRIREMIPQSLRHAVKIRMPHRIQDALTSFWRMGGTNWEKSPVICLLGDYDGYLRVNLKGRESEGVVHTGEEFEYWLEKTSSGLKTFVDADTGEPVVKDVLRGTIWG